jgi:hypothetical protein
VLPRPADPFLPGTTRGRMNQRALENAMNRLEVPRSIWQSSASDDDFGEGPRLDGRTILGRLNPITLFSHASDTPNETAQCQRVSFSVPGQRRVTA